MPDRRVPITFRLDPEVLADLRSYTATSSPTVSLNAAANFLLRAGLQVTAPDRLVELATLAEATDLIRKLQKRLDLRGTV